MGKSKSTNKLLGAFVPQAICDYLILYSIANKATKSKLLRQIITKWVDENAARFPAYELQIQITTDIQTRWNVKKMDIPMPELRLEFDKFRGEEATQLSKKGLNITSIKQIISLIKF